jgi:predicted nuclease of predicted toxin-antitoxin system
LKLLFDANLSPEPVGRLANLFPGSIHVFKPDSLSFTSEEMIREFSKSQEFVIVTADSDLLAWAAASGGPPKSVGLENCSYKAAAAADLLRRNAVPTGELEHFWANRSDHLKLAGLLWRASTRRSEASGYRATSARALWR